MPSNSSPRVRMTMLGSSALSSFFLLLLLAFVSDGSAATSRMNVIDKCWRRDPNWVANRQRLAMCSVGFAGKMRRNSDRKMQWYTVTDPSDDPVKPLPGTLRYGATMLRGVVWITFRRSMQIRLARPLVIKSFVTIDGRGADVHIAYGAGFLLYKVKNVIIHGLQFHDIMPQPVGPVIGVDGKVTQMSCDGDAIRLVASSKVWIDHNTLYKCHDGLLDVTRSSSMVTISNNWFRDHDKIMLLGHDDGFFLDRNMMVTIAFNRFGPNCKQRMPRIRYGYAHLVNNLYNGWHEYAIGGSMNPSVRSEGNLFIASTGNKKLTLRIAGQGKEGDQWNWQSVNDSFKNGAFFKQIGQPVPPPEYRRSQRFPVASPNMVRALTRDAGALRCSTRARC